MALGLGVGLPYFGSKGGVADAADGATSAAALFLAAYGPHGMVLNFDGDASISINDAADVLDFNSSGQVSGGALVGPGAKLTYSAPSLKLTEQVDGLLKFQAHNLYLNSAAPANQSITVLSGASYAITITGSVSMVASGAATGTWTAGTTTFTAATGTLTLGSTSGSGTVHLRRTPSVDNYIATTSAAAYDLPYVYSGGVRQGIAVEPAATNLALQSDDIANAAWTKSNGAVISGAFVTNSGVALNLSMVFRSMSKAASAVQYTFTADIEGQGLNRVTFRAQDSTGTTNSSTAVVSLSDGSAVSQTNAGTFSGASASARLLRAGVWRISLTFTSSADTFLRFVILPNDSVLTTGDGLLGIKINLIQFETGAVATSPIITYGSAVLRAADSLLLGAALFPQASGMTIIAKFNSRTPNNNVAVYRALTLQNAGATSRAVIYKYNTGAGAQVTDGGVTQFDALNDISLTSAGEPIRVALRMATNNTRAAVNGTLTALDTSATVPTMDLGLYLGSAGGTSNFLSGDLEFVAVILRELSDAELQAVTA